MLPYNAIEGQSLYDICLIVYGSANYMLKLIQDNGIPNINYRPVSGQTFMYDETISPFRTNRSVLPTYATAIKLSKGIVSYTPFSDITTPEGGIITLPSTASVTYSDGKPASVPVTWGSYSTEIAGNYVINGIAKDSDGYSIAVSVNLIVTAITDLDILRQIRDANPDSQLPSLWLDSEDPYTQWEGVIWDINNNKCVELSVYNKNITNLDHVNKLKSLYRLYCYNNNLIYLDIAGLALLADFHCYNNSISTLVTGNNIALQIIRANSNKLASIDLSSSSNCTTIVVFDNLLISLNINDTGVLNYLSASYNQLSSIPSLVARNNISTATFSYNKFDTAEVNRLLSIGFTTGEIGTQNP